MDTPQVGWLAQSRYKDRGTAGAGRLPHITLGHETRQKKLVLDGFQG